MGLNSFPACIDLSRLLTDWGWQEVANLNSFPVWIDFLRQLQFASVEVAKWTLRIVAAFNRLGQFKFLSNVDKSLSRGSSGLHQWMLIVAWVNRVGAFEFKFHALSRGSSGLQQWRFYSGLHQWRLQVALCDF